MTTLTISRSLTTQQRDAILQAIIDATFDEPSLAGIDWKIEPGDSTTIDATPTPAIERLAARIRRIVAA